MLTERRQIWGIVGLLTLAFLARWVFGSTLIIYPDSTLYLSFARAISEGGLTFDFVGGESKTLQPLYSLLVALFQGFFPSLESAALFVSLASGALLVLVVFLLCREVFGEKPAWIAAGLVAVDPLLIHWSGQMLTESLFVLLFTLALAFCWKALQQPNPSTLMLAGVVTGLACLGRYVGLIALVFFLFWIVLQGLWMERKNWKPVARDCLWALAGFLIVVGPLEIASLVYSDRWSIWANYGSVPTYMFLSLTGDRSMIDLIDMVLVNILQYFKLGLLVFPLLMLLLYLGIKGRGPAMLAGWIGAYLLVIIFFPVRITQDEYLRLFSPILPVLYIFGAQGILWLHERFSANVTRFKWHTVAVGVIVVLSLVLEAGQVRSYGVPLAKIPLWKQSEIQNVHLELADKIKKNLPPHPRIMSRKPQVPYYANATWYPVWGNDFPEIIRSAREKGVEYIQVDSRVDPAQASQLDFLLALPTDLPDLKLLTFLKDPGQVTARLALYQVRDADLVAKNLIKNQAPEEEFIARAVTLTAEGQIDFAIDQYQKALEINPGHFPALYNIATLHALQGEMEIAVTYFKKFAQLNPDSWEAHYNLGLAYLDLGQAEEAVREYQEVIRLRSDDPHAYFNLGIAYKHLQETGKAQQAMRQALALDPENASFHNNLANLYRQSGEMDLALQEFREALRLDPMDVIVNYNLGVMYEIRGESPEAIQFYETVLNLSGEIPQYRSYRLISEDRLARLKQATPSDDGEQ